MAEISDSDLEDIRAQLQARRYSLGLSSDPHTLLKVHKIDGLLERLPPPGARFDRKAYQRDLMRQRRAEGKA